MRVCTIVACNALAQARVLADSVAAQHPGAELTTLVVDDPEGTIGAGERFTTVRPRDIGVDGRELLRMAAMYSVQGLASSLKGHLLRHLLAHEASPVLLMDADIRVYAGLEQLTALAGEHEIVLSPHSLEPVGDSSSGISADRAFLRTGVFNGGFLGVGPGAEPFLDWWSSHLARDCVVDIGRSLYLSQSWLALVPALFRHHVLRDPGCNVMGHNALDRDVEFGANGHLTIEGVPLRFFHFTGLDFATGGWKSHDPRVYWWPSLDERPGIARLCREYAERLAAQGYATTSRLSSPYGALADGRPLDAAMRRAYRDGLVEAECGGRPEPPNPFVDGARAFVSWLNEPAVHPPGPTRLELSARAEAIAAASSVID